MRQNKRRSKFAPFLLSILTAMAVGVALSFAGIEGVKSLAKSNLYANLASVSSVEDISEENSEEDPTFISHFSRAFMYSAKDEKISIEDLPGDTIGSLKSALSTPISALAYSIINVDSNTVVLEKDSDRLLPIASVTKLVTAVVARNLLGDEGTIPITAIALSTEGDTGKLWLGEKYKLKEILYPLLMVSSNDAAEAIARAYGRQEFIKAMNDWASSIGAYRTYFRDPSGISANNLSTAQDVTIIAQWIKKNEPDIFDITLTKTKSIRTHTWVNPTHFLNLSEYSGGKNGYTPEANRTSISLFSVGFPKNLYAVVLLGSKQRDVDTLSVLNEALK